MFVDDKSEALAIQQKYYGDTEGLTRHLIRISLMRTSVVYEVFVLLDNYSTLDVGCRFISHSDIYALVRTDVGLFLCRKLHDWLTTIKMAVHPVACSGNAASLILLKSIIDAAIPKQEPRKLKTSANAKYDISGITIETNSNPKESRVYRVNKSGMIHVRELVSHPATKFIVADGQSVPEEYLSPRAAASLFNVSEKYSETYPNDEKLVFTAGSASNGKPGICGSEPCHRSHQQGSCVDIRYMDGNGKDIKSDAAYQSADINRTVWLIRAFAKDGLTKAFTGDNTRFGLPDTTPKTRSQNERVHRHHLHCGY